MNDSHIAIFNLSGPTCVHPTLSIVSTLVRRGYRVTYVTSERFRREISRLGAEVLLTPGFQFPFNQDPSDALPIDRQYSKDLYDLASRTLSLVSPFYEENVPNLVLYDACALAGPILAERVGAPAIRITPQLALDDENLDRTTMQPDFRRYLRNRRKRIDDFLRDHGVHRSDVVYNREDPTIYFYSSDFQLSQHQSDRHSLYAGRCAAERPYFQTWKSKRTDDRRAILISASTTYIEDLQYYKLCMEAVSELKWHAVIAIGANNDAASFDPLPAHCEIVQDIPQIAVMPQVDVIIGLGGMATTMEAAYHGLPIVMLTRGYPEAEVYAENVHKHGLGIHLDKAAATVDNIRECIVRVVEDTALRNRVKQLQHMVKRSPGAEEVVNWLEGHLEGRR